MHQTVCQRGWYLLKACLTLGFFQQMGLWFSTATRGMWQQAAQTVGGVDLKAPLCKGWAKTVSEDAYKAKTTLKYLFRP